MVKEWEEGKYEGKQTPFRENEIDLGKDVPIIIIIIIIDILYLVLYRSSITTGNPCL